MKKYIFIYHGKSVRPEDVRKEDMQETMDKWMAWFDTFKDKMVDGGNPFAVGAQSVSAHGVDTIEADKKPATGYTIINATDMNEATTIAKGCPVLDAGNGGTVEVYEAMPM